MSEIEPSKELPLAVIAMLEPLVADPTLMQTVQNTWRERANATHHRDMLALPAADAALAVVQFAAFVHRGDRLTRENIEQHTVTVQAERESAIANVDAGISRARAEYELADQLLDDAMADAISAAEDAAEDLDCAVAEAIEERDRKLAALDEKVDEAKRQQREAEGGDNVA